MIKFYNSANIANLFEKFESLVKLREYIDNRIRELCMFRGLWEIIRLVTIVCISQDVHGMLIVLVQPIHHEWNEPSEENKTG